MRILIIGAGPAGLSFAALLAQADPSHEITLIERNAVDVRPGFGITLRSDGISLLGLDSRRIFQHLEGRAFRFRGELIVDLPYPPHVHLITLSRAALVNTLIDLCSQSGVQIQFGTGASRFCQSDFEGFDLVVAADGANSRVRRMYEQAFAPVVEYSRNRYAWFGTDVPLNKLTIMLDDSNIVLLAWGYRYTELVSTLIVECSDKSIKDFGLDLMDARQTAEALGRIFARDLQGASVICGTKVEWMKFPTVSCGRLQHLNIALIGDAAHTTHFSQGFGTLFAFDDAIALQTALASTRKIAEALELYETTQRPKIAQFQDIASLSRQWSESLIERAERGDEGQVRELISARWPKNDIPPSPGARAPAVSTPPRPSSVLSLKFVE